MSGDFDEVDLDSYVAMDLDAGRLYMDLKEDPTRSIILLDNDYGDIITTEDSGMAPILNRALPAQQNLLDVNRNKQYDGYGNDPYNDGTRLTNEILCLYIINKDL